MNSLKIILGSTGTSMFRMKKMVQIFVTMHFNSSTRHIESSQFFNGIFGNSKRLKALLRNICMALKTLSN